MANAMDSVGKTTPLLRLVEDDFASFLTRAETSSILPGGCVVIRLPGEKSAPLDGRTKQLLRQAADMFRTGKIDRLETAIDALVGHLRAINHGRNDAEMIALIDKTTTALSERLQQRGVGARSREVLISDVKARLQAELTGNRVDRLDPSTLDARMERLLRYYVLAAADGQVERAGAIAEQIVAGLQQRTEGKPAPEIAALIGEAQRALRDFAAFEGGERGRRAERSVTKLISRMEAICRPTDPYPALPPALESDLKAWLQAVASGDGCASQRLARTLRQGIQKLTVGKSEGEVREILHQVELLLRASVPPLGPERGRCLPAIAKFMRELEAACRPSDPYPALPPALESDLKAWLQAVARGDGCASQRLAKALNEAVEKLAAGKSEAGVQEILHQVELLLRRLVPASGEARDRALAAVESLMQELETATAAPSGRAPPASPAPQPPEADTAPPAPAPMPMPEPAPSPPIVVRPPELPAPPPVVILPPPVVVVLPWSLPWPPVVVRPPFIPLPPPIVIRLPIFPPSVPPIVVHLPLIAWPLPKDPSSRPAQPPGVSDQAQLLAMRFRPSL